MEIVSEKYQSWLEKQKRDYKSSQVKAAVAVNAEMLKFYWALGADIVRMEPDQPWGSKFMQHLNDDLRREIPDGALMAEKESLIADLEQYKKSLIFECVTGKREVA